MPFSSSASNFPARKREQSLPFCRVSVLLCERCCISAGGHFSRDVCAQLHSEELIQVALKLVALSPSSQMNGANRNWRSKPDTAFVEIFAKTPTGFTKSQVRLSLLLTDLWWIRNVLWLILSLRPAGDWQWKLLFPSEPCPVPACIQLCLLRSLQLTASYCSAPWKAQAAPEVSFATHCSWCWLLGDASDWAMHPLTSPLLTQLCNAWGVPPDLFEESPSALEHENCFLSSPT